MRYGEERYIVQFGNGEESEYSSFANLEDALYTITKVCNTRLVGKGRALYASGAFSFRGFVIDEEWSGEYVYELIKEFNKRKDTL